MAVWLAAGILALLGLKIPKLNLSRETWTIIFLIAVALLLLRAVYRLERDRIARSRRRIFAEFAGGQFNTYSGPTGGDFAGKYFHIDVWVDGFVHAVGGNVRSLRQWNGTEFVEMRLLAPIPLAWVREPASRPRIDLGPHDQRSLNFVFNQSHQPEVLFSTDSYVPSGVPYGLGNQEGRYEVEVSIDSATDEVPAETLTFVVETTPRWDKLNVGVMREPMPSCEEFEYPVSARMGLNPTGGTVPTDVAREQELQRQHPELL